jgi:ATP-dependent exoDNAse (exonuclease V) alpha subunit
VRLIGDPRQAKAVGAGGALELVAQAGNAPELNELHRFTHAWEGPASLALRTGDTTVIDTYEAHDRIRSGSYASMLEDTYRQYRDTTADEPGAAVMIVSDNHSVQALSERARADRVADGRVEPGGVGLHDGSVAGIGDLIVTRRNDRRITTGPSEAAFVKNRDRWQVTGRDPDGTLTARRVDSDQTATLPADYVAEHVELSYALTGYGAQGTTVKEALAIVQPGDERSFAYVAASRGTDTNMIRVVTETLDEESRLMAATAARRMVKVRGYHRSTRTSG